MTRQDQRDILSIIASLLGIVFGRWLRDAKGSPPTAAVPAPGQAVPAPTSAVPTPTTAAPATRVPADAAQVDAALTSAPAAPATPLVSISSLFAATTLARRLGEQSRLPEDNLAGQACLAFGVAAGLTYFADSLVRYLPGIKPGPSGAAD